MTLNQVVIEPMPDNPARDRSGVSSGLWKTVIYKRRGTHVTNKDFQHIDQEDMTFEEARERAVMLRQQWDKED